MISETAIKLTKLITPKYPLGYTEVHQITLSYLTECLHLRVSYNWDELNRRLQTFCKRGF